MNLLVTQGPQPDITISPTIEIKPVGWIIIGIIIIALIICTILIYKHFNPKEETPERKVNNNTKKRYCKYCGKKITQTPQYCPHCNKDQT